MKQSYIVILSILSAGIATPLHAMGTFKQGTSWADQVEAKEAAELAQQAEKKNLTWAERTRAHAKLPTVSSPKTAPHTLNGSRKDYTVWRNNNLPTQPASPQQDDTQQETQLTKLALLADKLPELLELLKNKPHLTQDQHDSLSTITMHYQQQMITIQRGHALAMQAKQDEFNRERVALIEDYNKLQSEHNQLLRLLTAQNDEKLMLLVALAANSGISVDKPKHTPK